MQKTVSKKVMVGALTVAMGASFAFDAQALERFRGSTSGQYNVFPTHSGGPVAIRTSGRHYSYDDSGNDRYVELKVRKRNVMPTGNYGRASNRRHISY